jgi:hypothetical protein
MFGLFCINFGMLLFILIYLSFIYCIKVKKQERKTNNSLVVNCNKIHRKDHNIQNVHVCVGNPGPGLRQAQKCGSNRLVQNVQNLSMGIHFFVFC